MPTRCFSATVVRPYDLLLLRLEFGARRISHCLAGRSIGSRPLDVHGFAMALDVVATFRMAFHGHRT
jgi:hypothetical protein